jgi:3-hydroxyacyl-CoA dehydrogenase
MNDPVVAFSRIGAVGIITIKNPPVNVMNQAVIGGIEQSVKVGEQDEQVKALVLIAEGRTFISGADISVFRKQESKLRPHPMLTALEDCRKTTICAMHGTAYGGGLETAMACHYRIALASTQIAHPEAKLGTVPGAGGTQRLPRLAGVAKAIEMCTEGNPMGAAEALQCGILDQIVEKDLLKSSLDFAAELIAQNKPPRRTRDLSEKLGDERTNAPIFAAAREQATKRHRGRTAPLRAIDAIEAATKLPFEEGIRFETELAHETLQSEQSQALIHVFFAEREISKVPGVTKDTPVVKVRKAGIVGAGTMGSAIAMAYANAGIPVILKDASHEALARSLARIWRTYERAVRKGRLTPEQAKQRFGMIRHTLTYQGFSDVDVAIESVFEDMYLKKQIFTELDRVCKPEAILATNTSWLDIDQIASATTRPERVVGQQFFAPANIMPLMEIVRGKATSNEVIASSLALSKKLGKIGVLVGNWRGFAGNRMYHKYQREAQLLLEDGAQVQEVDAALYDFGMEIGPFASSDHLGLDVAWWRIREEYRDLEIPGLRHPLVADRLCDMGRFGQKTGAGWYQYRPGDHTPIVDPEVQAIIEDCSKAAGIKRRSIAPEEIVERTVYALINEGAKILGEGSDVGLKAVAIDVLFIKGYRLFPAHRGGPMWFASSVGLKKIYERIREFERQFGTQWTPAPLLKHLAEEGKTFQDFDKAIALKLKGKAS